MKLNCKSCKLHHEVGLGYKPLTPQSLEGIKNEISAAISLIRLAITDDTEANHSQDCTWIHDVSHAITHLRACLEGIEKIQKDFMDSPHIVHITKELNRPWAEMDDKILLDLGYPPSTDETDETDKYGFNKDLLFERVKLGSKFRTAIDELLWSALPSELERRWVSGTGIWPRQIETKKTTKQIPNIRKGETECLSH